MLFSIAALLGSGGLELRAQAAPQASKVDNKNAQHWEGPYTACQIDAGPFDIHRKYQSMEGPWVEFKIPIGDLIASKHVVLPESMVRYVEGNLAGGPAMGAPGMNDHASGSVASGPALLKSTADKSRQLYWFKGMKLEVLDENNKVLPDGEFICHLNVDVDQDYRNKIFPEGERCNVFRVITITQGQTNMRFPEGFAVPVASDERWTVVFQAANRTTNEHRRLKHRCTMFFIKDSDLVTPVKALGWYIPAGVVVVDKDTPEAHASETAHECSPTTMGVHAPNKNGAPVISDRFGRKVTGHWVVPPGRSTFTRPVAESVGDSFAAKERRIHFVWTHIHPCCTSAALVDCANPDKRSIFDIKANTRTKGGLELLHIDTISSKAGIVLPAGHHYEVEATYDNPTGQPLDSMVSFGIFFEDNTFARPDWAIASQHDTLFCGVSDQPHKNQPAASSTPDGNTPLMLALYNNNEELAKKLIAEKGDITRANERGDTALHFAAVRSSSGMVALLLANGAELNAKNGRGETPLMIAIGNKNRQVALSLIQKGANVNIANIEGTTPLIMSTFLNDTEESLALINAGASTTPINKFGESVIKLAIQNNNRDILAAASAKLSGK
jgi:ankyrin repeat protein